MDERLKMIEGVYNIKPSDIMASVALEKFETNNGLIEESNDMSVGVKPALSSPNHNRSLSPASKASPPHVRSSQRNPSQIQQSSNKRENLSIVGG